MLITFVLIFISFTKSKHIKSKISLSCFQQKYRRKSKKPNPGLSYAVRQAQIKQLKLNIL